MPSGLYDASIERLQAELNEQGLSNLVTEGQILQQMETMYIPRMETYTSNLTWTARPAPTLAQLKAAERQELKKLIATGQSALKMYSDGNLLIVKGRDFNNVKVLFVLDNTKMLAPKKRTTHLKALLTKLAQREGVKLELVDELPSRAGRAIIYWPFKLQVDDSALLVAKPREQAPEQPETDDDEDELPDEWPF